MQPGFPIPPSRGAPLPRTLAWDRPGRAALPRIGGTRAEREPGFSSRVLERRGSDAVFILKMDLWDGDGTSRFPPCLGAHRFEELFCFLDFFSPCSPRPESSPSPRPRGHRLLTPSAESVRRVRSLPRPRTPHGGSRGEAEPPRCGDDARDGAAQPQTITSLLPPPRGPSARGSALERVRREGFAPFLLGFARQNPNPVRFYYAGS